jgi:hypothetical protein
MESVQQHVHWHDFDCDGIYYLEHTEIVTGSDFDFDDNGIEIKTEPEYETYFSMNDGTYRCDGAGEVTGAIDTLLQKSLAYDGLAEMEIVLNFEG